MNLARPSAATKTVVLKEARKVLLLQNHPDSKKAGRAVWLQMEVGKAGDALSLDDKLHECALEILQTIHQDFQDARGDREWSDLEVLEWVEQKHQVHPARINSVTAALLSSSPEDAIAELANEIVQSESGSQSGTVPGLAGHVTSDNDRIGGRKGRPLMCFPNHNGRHPTLTTVADWVRRLASHGVQEKPDQAKTQNVAQTENGLIW